MRIIESILRPSTPLRAQKNFVKEVDNSEKLLTIEEHRVSSKDTWYRVTMGGFKSREAALQKVNSLVKKGVIYIPPEYK